MPRHTVTLKQRACPACAAPMPPVPPDAHEVACEYCAQRFEVVKPRPSRRSRQRQQRRARPTEPQPEPSEKPPAGNRGIRRLMRVAASLTVLVLSAAATIWYVDITTIIPGFLQSLTPSTQGAATNQTRGLQWAGQFPSPAFADVNQNGTLDLIAIFTTSSGSNESAWVGAFDGETLREHWRYGPISAQNSQLMGVAATETHLVVQEPFGVVSVLELATGKRTAQHQLPKNQHRAELCRLDPEGDEVLVSGQMIVNTRTGVARTQGIAAWTERPAHCAFRRLPGTSVRGHQAWNYARRRTDGYDRPSFEGMKTSDMLRDGPHGVALAEPSRGSPTRTLILFDPKDGSERLRVPLSGRVPDDALTVRLLDLGLGTAVVLYRMGHTSSTIAVGLDAETGEKRWELDIEGVAHGSGFGAGRVWIVAVRHPKNFRVLGISVNSGDDLTFGGR